MFIVGLNKEQFQLILEMQNYQKTLVTTLDDDYVKGFHDGVEIIMSIMESRDPELTQVNPDHDLLM